MADKAGQVIKGVTFASLYILIYSVLQMLAGAEMLFLDLSETEIANLTGVATIVAAAAAFLIFKVSFWLRGLHSEDEYVISRPYFTDVLLATAMSVGFRLVTNAYMTWAEGIEPLAKSIDDAGALYDYDAMSSGAMLAMIAATIFIAPLFEEILFRGIAMSEMKRVMPASLAIVLQGVFFGIAHMVLAQSIFATVYGIILGYVYYKTKKLSVTMTAHFVFNLSSMVELMEFQVVSAAIIGSVITAAAIIIFSLQYRDGKN